MSQIHKANIAVSPWSVLLLAAFVAVGSPVLLAALLLAALSHELGHYAVLRAFGAVIDTVRISAFGAELCLADRPTLSYGQEVLSVAAGPAINLLCSGLLSWCGRQLPVLYIFSGAQLVLALFNLLPVRPLDGGTILWLLLAWWSDPFLADWVTHRVGIVVTGILLFLSLWLMCRTGNPFLLLGVVGLGKSFWQEKGLVKKKESR